MTHKPVSIFDPKILAPGARRLVQKLDPRLMVKNPVMFVTMVGAAISTVEIFRSPGQTAVHRADRVWLWFTVLFANFAEAVAEGRGKAQAQSACAKPARRHQRAQRLAATAKLKKSGRRFAPQRRCHRRRARAKSFPPTAKSSKARRRVDESAITGESAPVIRESGGDRSAVTGGTRVLSDEIKIRITANPAKAFWIA